MGAAEDSGCDFFTLVGAQIEQIVEIEQQSFSSPWSAEDLRRIIRDADALCLGMSWRRKVIGYGMGYLEKTDFHLVNLAIDPLQRRRGWAGVLLQKILTCAREKGCRRCILEVRVTNQAAIRLYRRYGFEQAAVHYGYYRKPREDALVMCRGIEEF